MTIKQQLLFVVVVVSAHFQAHFKSSPAQEKNSYFLAIKENEISCIYIEQQKGIRKSFRIVKINFLRKNIFIFNIKFLFFNDNLKYTGKAKEEKIKKVIKVRV